MKSWISILVGCVVIAGLGCGPLLTGLTNTLSQWEGVKAPDFTATTLDGETVSLNGLAGKRVLLVFWATWCPPCRKEIPDLIALRKELDENALAILAISNEDEGQLRTFAKEKGINYRVASARNLPSPYGDVQAIPTTFVIDRNGVIQAVSVGYGGPAKLREHATAEDFAGTPKPPPQ